MDFETITLEKISEGHDPHNAADGFKIGQKIITDNQDFFHRMITSRIFASVDVIKWMVNICESGKSWVLLTY
jgi:hypothetical protein